jgi:hypothetical protein
VPDFTPVTFANAFGCGGGAGDLVGPQAGQKIMLLEGSQFDPLVQTTVATDAPYTVRIAQA